MPEIKYPYLPKRKAILYVGLDNKFMQAAKTVSEGSACVKQPTGAVVVKDEKIIGRGSNAGKKVKECPRWGSPTGTNYEPCRAICRQEGHSEVTSIRDARKNGFDTEGADLYLYGHWWCCKDCWNEMLKAGIKDVYLFKGSWDLFNPKVNKEMKSWGKSKNK